MPLFRAEHGGEKARPRRRRRRTRNVEWVGSCGKTDENGHVLSLTRLCLQSLADNMKDVWAKDYADNYLDHYSFRYIMGPFNSLPGELVEELTWLLCTRKQMSRAALHLMLVPQLRGLSLEGCPGLVNSTLCGHIAARCQGLWSLDLSGAQQLPSKVLCETLCCLPALRSLSLAGTPCDRCVIKVIAQRCPLLRHLDLSRCHLLSPAALLPLGGGGSFLSSGAPSRSPNCTSQSSISSSCSAPLSPLPLSSLLALDIGFGEQEGDPVAAAAYLLLTLNSLERMAMEGLAQACCLIQQRQFNQTDEFTDREGVPRLMERWREWREWRHRQGMDSGRRMREAAFKEEEEEEEEEERTLWDGFGSDSEEEARGDGGANRPLYQNEDRKRGRDLSDDGRLVLRLKDVKGISCDSLDSLSLACPNISSISVNVDDFENTKGESQGSLLATGLKAWSAQLRSLSMYHPGPLLNLLPALQVACSSLVSLTLEGVKTGPHTPLLEVIKACPRLRDLLISAEPPTAPWEAEEDQRAEQDLPRLANLCSLTLNFSYEHGQMKPVMSCMSLTRVLKCLLAGSPLLEKLSLVSLPCPLNSVIQEVLHVLDQYPFADSTNSCPMPLGRVQRVYLPRTDVTMTTVRGLMQRSKRLKYVDVSYCWQISQLEWRHCEVSTEVQVVWL